MRLLVLSALAIFVLTSCHAFVTPRHRNVGSIITSSSTSSLSAITDEKGDGTVASTAINEANNDRNSRRTFLTGASVAAATTMLAGTTCKPKPAEAIGPVKLTLEPTSYSAAPCPPERPIPGEKAMLGMRGLCVTVKADLQDTSPKDLEKVGVYGFVTDGDTGDSVLANNPDLSTDAGQFAMIESVTPKDKKVVFEFIAAVPREKDLSQYQNGIGPLKFEGLRLISFPGGQQYGAINPCEMNEFSDECAAWEEENGPYKQGEFMMKGKKK